MLSYQEVDYSNDDSLGDLSQIASINASMEGYIYIYMKRFGQNFNDRG